MPRDAVNAPGAPAAVGPYSHAVRAGELIFTSGQVGLDPATGKLVDGGVTAEAEQVFRNLHAVLEASGHSFRDVVKATVYLTDMTDFAAVNAVYAKQFTEPYPARTTIAVAALPVGARVEVELVAR
ncbi:MAG TPA: RidA family protein [Deinococcales bacterium]|nr:RidA family protein [Deinococcales bacterium]